ncbi:MAG: hypothetical protein ACTSUT_16340 [Promethearchaeota archaeon]
MFVEKTDLTIRIPLELKKRLQKYEKSIDSIISEALEVVIDKYISIESYSELTFPEKKLPDDIEGSDIPNGHFLRIPNLSLEDS